ncbi:4-hydroxy-tetrahydrodipicolinate reductase [Leptospira sp. GIMC2001]|uniref:4-hydroxy-tetrahydrodipicolinate reductase n=1 Tax=Leptospira sp. GIMC2001 TaxID=1513297 RepID=UPI00234A4AD7|nr:4-hydroxy-tetrahydrodipicolinate reductase [Leptospira sp. GIMC2001]WCL48742.1 4-hydroxy-tetrahydrodipicolinate reductase [Leptospira sp. GIMC2001]
MNKIALIGAGGRMGRAITQAISNTQESSLAYAVVRPDSYSIGFDSGLHCGIKENGVKFTSDLEEAIQNSDGVIDFSSVDGLEKVLSLCLQYNKPLVIGLTGLTSAQKKKIEDASNSIPIVLSPNMSVGVNLLFKLTEIAAKVLGDDFDVEVLDIHHRHKKDSPSGTANKIKEVLVQALERKESDVIYGRHGIYPERSTKEIGVHTMRAGEVVGEHTVYFFSPEERIEITHKAQDRKTFGVGSVKAVEFVIKQKPGFYDMFNVLGI